MAKLTDHEANEVIKDYIYYRKICEECDDTEVKTLSQWLKINGYNIEDFPIEIDAEDKGRFYRFKGRLFSTKKITEVINDIAKEVGKTSKMVIKNIAYKGVEGLKDTNIKGDYKFDIRKAMDSIPQNTIAELIGQKTKETIKIPTGAPIKISPEMVKGAATLLNLPKPEEMRDLTEEERKASKEALKKISTPTGVHINFTDNKHQVGEKIISDTGIEEVISVGSNDTYMTKTILSKDQFIEAYNKYVKSTLDIPKDLDEQEKDIDEALKKAKEDKSAPTEETTFIFPYSYDEIIEFAKKNHYNIVLSVTLDYRFIHFAGVNYNIGEYLPEHFTKEIYDAMVTLYYEFLDGNRLEDLTTYVTKDRFIQIQTNYPELFCKDDKGKVTDVYMIKLPELPFADPLFKKCGYPTNLQSIDILFKRRRIDKEDNEYSSNLVESWA